MNIRRIAARLLWRGNIPICVQHSHSYCQFCNFVCMYSAYSVGTGLIWKCVVVLVHSHFDSVTLVMA